MVTVIHYKILILSEIIWSVLKAGIKVTYKTIQNKDFMYFLKEQEFKYKNRKLKYDELIT